MSLGSERIGWALAASLLVVGVCSSAAAQTPLSDAETELVGRINMMRSARDLPALERHPGLDEAARTHSADMARRDDLAHLSPETGDPAARVAEAGVEAERVGENIAQGADPIQSHESIIQSDPHREQLLDARFTHVGVGVVRDAQGRAWVTQVLGALAGDAPDAEDGNAAPEAPAPQAPAPEAPAPQAPAEPPPPSTPELETDPGPAPDAEFTEPMPEPPQAAPTRPASQRRAPTATAPSQAGVRAYWVHDGRRWWYYPVPANARPGQVLQPDPSVKGPPPPTARQNSRVRIYIKRQPPPPPPPRTRHDRRRSRHRVIVHHGHRGHHGHHGHHPHVRFGFDVGFRIGGH